MNNNLKIQSRNSLVLPCHVKSTYLVYNGKQYIKIQIIPEMIGFKFGEFVKTRKTFKFKKN